MARNRFTGANIPLKFYTSETEMPKELVKIP